MKTTDKLLTILKEGGKLAAGTVKRDIQQGKATSLDERLVNYYFMRGVAVLPIPGTQIWYLQKDSDGYCDIGTGKFIALGRDCVVLSSDKDPEYLIKECEGYYGCRSRVFVVPVGDAFESEEEAEEELAKRGKLNGI